MTTIAFIGFRGSGKTTLGKWLADERGIAFVDTDEVVLAYLGHETVTRAWEAVGEKGWREAEMHLIPELLKKGGVVSLGGGAPMIPLVAKAVARCEVVFNLTASDAVTSERLGSADDRPTLSAGNREARLSRLPDYALLGTCGIDTSSDIDACKLRILDFLEHGHQLPGGTYILPPD
jgi:shikimate kinase